APQTAAVQRALKAELKSPRARRALRVDGLYGRGTARAVAAFQRQSGLRPTGVVDRETERRLFAAYQSERGLPVSGGLDAATSGSLSGGRPAPRGWLTGAPGDFEADGRELVIRNALTTVYTPYLARGRAAARMEGPPVDRRERPICTLERYLTDRCPYVSVAIDRRLGVPYGTPLLIPEISRLVGRTVRFRIVDTGSTRYFTGAHHVDVATDSDQTFGLGAMISSARFTLILPHGLRPSVP
ncbi:MAG: peptidoglycan-binding protein, partial [Elusimicrobia bacterium]|nr:peptidoglycan-binding protein [Elusimicrobiota bacterium]